jgi:hypothetical protein
MTAVESYENNLLADATSVPSSPYAADGAFSEFTPQVIFTRRGGRLQIAANANSNVRYYPALDRVLATNHSAEIDVVGQLTRADSLSVKQAASYAPSYLYGLLRAELQPTIGIGIPTGADYRISQTSFASTTSVDLTHTFTPRSTMTVDGGFMQTTFRHRQPGMFDMNTASGGARWDYAFDRRLTLRMGYTYRHSTYAPTRKPIEHDLDIGVVYTRPISATRHWRLGLSAGPALARGTLSEESVDSSDRPHYRFQGNAFVERDLGRSWLARLDYQRGLSYVAGLTAPVYSDRANVETSGFLNRRTDVAFSAAVATGTLAQRLSPGQFTTYSGDAHLRFALTREWAVYLEALYYDYAFDQNLLLPGQPRTLSRAAARLGVTWWLPLRSR